MRNDNPERVPTDIKLHQKSRILSIEFSDGEHFGLPCEYLRVFSPAAEVRATRAPVTGKERVGITRIEPVGHYAVRLHFDDGHDTGVYSWDTLYQLGMEREANWAGYLDRLEAAGYQREDSCSALPRSVEIFYFSWLVNAFRKETERLERPASVTDVSGLLALLRRRGKEFGRFLGEGSVRVTVNRQFAESFTTLDDGDEVGIVPSAPQPVDV